MNPSPRHLICQNGHRVEATSDELLENGCPHCGTTLHESDGAPAAKGLWAMMQRESVGEPVPAPVPEAAESSRPRGLWAMMESQPSSLPAAVESPVIEEEEPRLKPLSPEPSLSSARVEDESADPTRQLSHEVAPTTRDSIIPPPRPAWLGGHAELPISQVDPEQTSVGPSQSRTERPLDTALESDEDESGDDESDEDESDDEDGWEIDDPDGEARAAMPVLAVEAASPQLRRRNPLAAQSALLGALAVGLMPLHFMSGWWAKWPAGVVGLGAVLFGHQAWSLGRRQQASKVGSLLSIVAMICGGVAMLAGPVVGGFLRQTATRVAKRDATLHLTKIGEGLGAFHDDHGHFPAGGTIGQSPEGEDISLHSWMTALLPHVGRDDLFQVIDHKRPFDHPQNLPHMAVVVDAFLSPGVPHAPTLLGLATTHFSGLGGVRETETGEVQLGIFDRNSAVRRDAIVDGLSQTFVVGEIAQNTPPWGDPENWRQLDAGLNEHPFGFGNAARTGAHFLMADGSVRFLPNHTSLEVLQKLATRNGGEVPVDIPPAERK